MIFNYQPKDFNPAFDVVSCFVQRNGEFLNLLRDDAKPEGGMWGVPAGKIDEGEDQLSALEREVWEETGLDVLQNDFSYFKTLFVRYPEYDFVYHMYSVDVPKRSRITINPVEHKGYMWATPKDALQLPLVRDMKQCIEMFYKDVV